MLIIILPASPDRSKSNASLTSSRVNVFVCRLSYSNNPLLARAIYYIYQFKDNIAQSQLALDEYKKGLQTMSDKLNSPQPKYMTDVRFTYLLP